MAAPWARGARVIIKGRMHGSVTNNVLHFATNTVVNDGGQLDDLLVALAVAVMACIVDQLLPGITSDWELEQVSAQAIYPTLGDPVVSTPPANTKGTSPGTNVSFASSLVNIRTGIDGRKGRGKMFLPPPGDSVITASKLDQAPIDAIVDFLECVFTKFNPVNGTEQWRFGVLSRKDLNGNINNFNAAFRQATQLTPQPIVATMHSRKLNVGA